MKETDYYYQDYPKYSVYFGEYNTWDMWHLIPTSRPSIAPPEVKTNLIEIPGGNGSLDLSDALTGFPTFGDRSGSITFMCLDNRPWYEINESLLALLHNKTMTVTLSEDPDWYYEGRIEVGEWTSNKDYSTVDINYTFRPFKTSKSPKFVKIDEESFETVDTSSVFTLNLEDTLSKTSQVVNPTIWINGEGVDTATFNFSNTELNYSFNSVKVSPIKKTIDEIILSNFNGENTVVFTFSNYTSGSDIRMLIYEKRI